MIKWSPVAWGCTLTGCVWVFVIGVRWWSRGRGDKARRHAIVRRIELSIIS
jgi:hypothetical protein